jgi:hypothetical protein
MVYGYKKIEKKMTSLHKYTKEHIFLQMGVRIWDKMHLLISSQLLS